ncbi:PSD1 and planctomycete cytochrome C domain-containing protein [Frigoriglobus tundricola]|uniref:Cytochrome c domain-containing protein n=1 Tax=Frigoriglobus tundricola TaxID=2774151 RepID=A0A6M5Z1J6_9BACT|nr:PSD1 and planctomycete cytochrome C domain-containing protein [Frigoriglobus tundricola]QJW99520.1 hypothetical protein FTUN_7132 [Frigoriglobus tundricola]
MRISTAAVLTLLTSTALSRAAEPVNNEYFESKVRPILVANCVNCHGATKQKGGLRLDAKAEFAKGGDNGPVVVPGDPAKSLLVKTVAYEDDTKMPPKGKLTDAEIAVLTAWVKGGAPWPDDGAIAKEAGDKFDLHARAKTHWSFQPVRRPAVPELTGAAKSVAANEIDRFLLAKLGAAGLTYARPAEKRTLLRRVYLDLTGLPPSPAEIDAFLKDESPRAFEKVVDRLLASPAYGERWGRHWLDLVRYAETHGHEFDFEIPDAWRYRDYVIRAFNADVPFDRFLTEHVAGDLLPPRRDPKSGVNDALIATGFWWLGEAKHSPVDSRAEFADRTDNQIDVFGKTVLGLTISCARCHDHKFDAIATKDYYALFGVLSSSRYNRADVSDPVPAVKVLGELKAVRAELAARVPVTKAEVPSSPQLGAWREKTVAFELFGPDWRKRWDADGLAFRPGAGEGFPHSGREAGKLIGALRSPTFTIDKPFLAVRTAGRDARARLILNGLQLIQDPIYGGLAQGINHGSELRWTVFDLRMWKGQPAYLELIDDGAGWVAISEARFADTLPPGEAGPQVPLPDPPASDDPELKRLRDRVRELEAKIPAPQRAPTIRDGTGLNEHVFVRGNHKTLGVEAPRATLEAFGQPPFSGPGSGRLELARTLTDPSNPLVARVIVNRLWKHHFGEGIVRSPDDFGRQGQAPTHPDLLDWLARELVAPERTTGGDARPWSLKRMHKLMVLSAAYQQASRTTPDQAAKAVTADPQNKLLHRQNVKRLEAEAIRDSILVASGRIDPKMEGPGVLPHLTEHQAGRGRPGSGPLDGNGRRSVYLQVRRNFISPMFSAFDYPTPFTTIGRRTASNVPAQALVMLNNPFVIQQAELWAKRVLAAPGSAEDRVRGMYATAFGRPPTQDELAAATGFVAEQSKEYGRPDDPKAWSDLAHVLFNAKEFIFVE